MEIGKFNKFLNVMNEQKMRKKSLQSNEIENENVNAEF